MYHSFSGFEEHPIPIFESDREVHDGPPVDIKDQMTESTSIILASVATKISMADLDQPANLGPPADLLHPCNLEHQQSMNQIGKDSR